jgi:phosphate transport system permease protein
MKRPTQSDTAHALGFDRPRWFGLGATGSSEVNLGDRIFRATTALFAVGALITLGAIALTLLKAAFPAIQKFGLGFIGAKNWDPVHEDFGALPMIFGTVVSAVLALAIATPIALGVSIFLAEMAPDWLRRPIGFMVELLAAIPSVVYGLWGIFVLAPFLRTTVEPWLGAHFGWIPIFAGPARGFGMLASGLILAIMILPTIASVSRDVMRAVPSNLREGALALGATRWETVRMAVLPSASSGIVGAIVLGLGRALGETMAVTMVIGNRAEISASLFAPGYTMASVIANEYNEATNDLHLAALAEIGLLIFVVTLLLNFGARFMVKRVGKAPA